MRDAHGFLLRILLGLTTGNAFAGPQVTDELIPSNSNECADTPHPFCSADQWGYMDNEGHVVIAPTFEMAADFSGGLAAVRRNGVSGYVRPDGTWAFLLPAGANSARQFSENRAWYTEGGRYGCVDETGRTIISPEYDLAQEFSEGLAVVMRRRQSVPVTQTDEDSSEEWGYVDRNGRVAIPLTFASAGQFGDGLAAVVRSGGESFEFIDKSGAIAFSVKGLLRDMDSYVRAVGEFSEGRCYVVIDGRGPRVPYTLLMDRAGRAVGQAAYDSIGSFSEGRAIFRKGDKVGYVGLDGEVLIAEQYDYGLSFRCGLCAVRSRSHWMYIDRGGTVVAKAASADSQWNDAEDFHGGLARVHVDGSFVVTDDGPQYWHGGSWLYINGRGVIVGTCRKDSDKGAPFGKELQ